MIFSKIISGTGSIIKEGTGTLTLSGNNTYAGGTTISDGRLVATNATSMSSGKVTNNAALELAFTSDQTLANVITGTGSLTKTGSGIATLTANNSSAGAVAVNEGKLFFKQNGTFTADSYNTSANATTELDGNSLLQVKGAFAQSANANLNLDVGSNNTSIITADTATLDGVLRVVGFEGTRSTTASSLLASQVTVIDTANGVSGDFTDVDVGKIEDEVDYVQVGGFKSVDQKQYNIGFGLSWLASLTRAHGDFTLNNVDDVFDVDMALSDQSGTFTTGWDGKSLLKKAKAL